MVTCGADGTLRLWNYLEKPFHGLVSYFIIINLLVKFIFQFDFLLISKTPHGNALTAISAARTNVIAVGSELGVLRIFELSLTDERKAPSLIHRVRVHKSEIHCVKYLYNKAFIQKSN